MTVTNARTAGSSRPARIASASSLSFAVNLALILLVLVMLHHKEAAADEQHVLAGNACESVRTLGP